MPRAFIYKHGLIYYVCFVGVFGSFQHASNREHLDYVQKSMVQN